MRTINLAFILIISILFLTNCKKEDNSVDENKAFLVSKVFDYQNRMLADYIYNPNNQLVKRAFTDPTTGFSSDLVFNYIDNKVNEIQYIDHDFPQFNHSTFILYDSNNKITRSEVFQNGNIVSHTNYAYYSTGHLKHIFNDNSPPIKRFEYDNNGNVNKVTHYSYDPVTGGSSQQIRFFCYDNHKKPSFNLDDITQIELIPKMGSVGSLERNISCNNMTAYDGGGTKLSYEYNEYRLPISILTEWEGVVVEEPMLLKLEYIEK